MIALQGSEQFFAVTAEQQLAQADELRADVLKMCALDRADVVEMIVGTVDGTDNVPVAAERRKLSEDQARVTRQRTGVADLAAVQLEEDVGDGFVLGQAAALSFIERFEFMCEQQFRELVVAEQLVGIESQRNETLARRFDHETFRCQPIQRLPHRRRTDAESFGDRLHVDPPPLPKLVSDGACFDGVVNAVSGRFLG